MIRLITTLLSLLLIAVLTVLDSYDNDSAEHDQYCDMVTIYIESNGENGWPDYKRTYENECINE